MALQRKRGAPAETKPAKRPNTGRISRDKAEEPAQKLEEVQGLAARRDEMTNDEWITELVPVDAQKAITRKPCTDEYDPPTASHHRGLAHICWQYLASFSPSFGNFWSIELPFQAGIWPYALTRLNHLLMRCHDLINSYRLGIPEVRRLKHDHVTHDVDRKGRGIAATDVTLARLVVVELISLEFGLWLVSLWSDNAEVIATRFFSRRGSFNADFGRMDIEWGVVGAQATQHTWSDLPLNKLFADMEPGDFNGLRLRTQQRHNSICCESIEWEEPGVTTAPGTPQSEFFEGRQGIEGIEDLLHRVQQMKSR
ncbi:hypothetical protein NUW58_g5349 [Xylaria curta]|uniref:Uncharacterized protein n=1 Tax=Xylaria curta TaxID=42375 RepID=A0ACC1P3A2_9PEZI|nr:hypothetical protein NUW58_g5349 [Xylaria curta]